MSTPVVTFLIPCYNVAHCVEHCLQSILIPSILDSIEVLAINDGSTDNTLELLRRYEQQYPGVVRVLDKANGGWGSVINYGYRKAKGKYLKEIDADDWVESEHLEEYIEKLKTLDVDYIATDYKEYWANEDRYIPHTFQKEIYGKVQTIDDFWTDYPTAWDFPIHAVTYRTQFLIDSKLWIGNGYYTDIEYLIQPATHAKTITALPLSITVYFRGSDEQSTSTAGYAKHFVDYVRLAQRLVCIHEKLPELHPTFEKFINDTVYATAARAYYLMMSPRYAWNHPDRKFELKNFNAWVEENNRPLYFALANEKRHHIPYIQIWRAHKINVLRLTRVPKNKR